MAKNNVTTTEGKTLAEIKAELQTAVDNHNSAETIKDQTKYAVEAAKLKDDYNKASKLDAYAECLKAEKPMLAFIKQYTYPTISVAPKKDTGALSIKDDGKAVFDLWDFVEWCEGRNKQVVQSLDWKSKATEAQNVLIKQVKAAIEDGTEMSVKDFKEALQAMFDAIVMVEGKSGNNAVIAKSKNVRVIQQTCGALDVKSFTAKFVQKKSWQKQVLAILNRSVENKDFSVIYGDPEETTAATSTDEETTVGGTEETTVTEETKAE